jgi:hypothetical protein
MEREHLENLGVDRKVILKWIYRKWDLGHGWDCSGSGFVDVATAFECGNEPFGSIKCGGNS